MHNENLSKVLNLDSSEFFCLIFSLRPSYIEGEDILVWSNFHFKAKTLSRTHLLKTNIKKIAWDDNCISYYQRCSAHLNKHSDKSKMTLRSHIS